MKTEWNNDHHRALQQAFDSPWPGPTGEPIILEKGHMRMQINPQDGARITSLQAFGFDVLRQWEPRRKAFQYGCFPMVPWAGRLGYATLKVGDKRYALPANKPPHALHGMACYSAWTIAERKNNALTLRMSLGSPWPWQGEVLQTLRLEDDALFLRLEIHSAAEPFPASAGWHPWFAKRIGHQNEEKELQVLFDADWQEEAGSDELPTGKQISPQPGPWDDCFGFSLGFNVRLLWPGKLSMLMTSDAQSLIVFDKQPDAACVNPVTQAPNAINLAPHLVRAGVPLTIDSCWRFKSLV